MSVHSGDPNVFKGGCNHDCPHTCAMVWTEQLINRGDLCVKLKDFVKDHYADRVLYPQRRGPKGSGQYERITWEEALHTISG
ncbi:hypothetical protein, partial [Pseudomonas aeruginosa]|uniref:hypothetical protein n=1 Tax=Pseudomonas aeruginosa TaxID=287 RepID=UPI001C49F31E